MHHQSTNPPCAVASPDDPWAMLADITAERDALRLQVADLIDQAAGTLAELAVLHVDYAATHAEVCQLLEQVACDQQELASRDQTIANQLDYIAAQRATITALRASATSYHPPDNGETSQEMVSVDPAVLCLLLNKTAQTETLRAKYQRLSGLIADKRLKPGDKVLTAAVWDMLPASTLDGEPAAPRKVYRAALAERTGLSLGTISRKLQDMDALGLVQREVRQVGPDETELWLTPGRLPDASVSAEEINLLAGKRAEDRQRKVCPHCHGEHLRAVSYECLDCHEVCTDAEAREAGRHVHLRESGVIVDVETGEVLGRIPIPPGGFRTPYP